VLLLVDKEGACLRLMMLPSGGDVSSQANKTRTRPSRVGVVAPLTHPNIAHFSLLHCLLNQRIKGCRE